MTCFDCKVCFGSKVTSSAEGRRFHWLIYDSMTSLFACGRFSKSRGLSASVSFLPSFPFLFPLFYSLHSSPCNSLLPNCTETLATQASRNVEPCDIGFWLFAAHCPYAFLTSSVLFLSQTNLVFWASCCLSTFPS